MKGKPGSRPYSDNNFICHYHKLLLYVLCTYIYMYILLYQLKLTKLRAESANVSYCAVPFFKPRHHQHVLVVLYSYTLRSRSYSCQCYSTQDHHSSNINFKVAVMIRVPLDVCVFELL